MQRYKEEFGECHPFILCIITPLKQVHKMVNTLILKLFQLWQFKFVSPQFVPNLHNFADLFKMLQLW